MRIDAAPSGCDVVACPEPATGSYLHARDSHLLEFGICPAHYALLRAGARAAVVDDGPDPAGDAGRVALVLR